MKLLSPTLLSFFLLLASCQPESLTLKGSCQLGETKRFLAPNTEYITASVDSLGWLHLSGNLNLVPEPIVLATELRDTTFEEWEAKPLSSENFKYEIFLQVAGAKEFEFNLAYQN